MAKDSHQQTPNHHSPTWGTWEDLLLAFAVKRHGFTNWDSVAMELQTRTSLPHVLATAEHCKQKYHDLNRRFTTPDQPHQERINNGTTTTDKPVHIPWIEELRKLRVAELKQEVQRYDVSILTLQLKVKKLEEERERSLQEKEEENLSKPDLQVERSENDKPEEPSKSERDEKVSVSLSSRESDRENRSVNESNSTASEAKKEAVKMEEEPAGEGSGRAVPVLSGSNSKQEAGEEESDELGESASRMSGEVESSSASLGRKRKRKGTGRGEEEVGGGGGDDESKGEGMKPEPLIGLMDMIRANEHGSLFERRLESQVWVLSTVSGLLVFIVSCFLFTKNVAERT